MLSPDQLEWHAQQEEWLELQFHNRHLHRPGRSRAVEKAERDQEELEWQEAASEVRVVRPDGSTDVLPNPVRLRSAEPQTQQPWTPTARQRQVMELAAAGRTNKEIASDLECSVGNVEALLAKVYKEVGFRNRRALAWFLGASSAG